VALFVVTVSNYTWSGAETGFVRSKAYTILGAIFMKKKHKIRYKSEHVFRMRKEITTNYKFKKR
jgi:hypothetical protein